MVRNLNIVLDEGKIKYLPEVTTMGYDKEIWKLVHRELQVKLEKGEIDAWDMNNYVLHSADHGKQQLCYEYCKRHNIIPFIPFLTFNISPNWKMRPTKDCLRITKERIWSEDVIEGFGEVIKLFFGISQRFTKIEYQLRS